MPFHVWRLPSFRMANFERSEAVLMFGSLKNFLMSVAGDPKDLEDRDCQLATAALLTRVATVDSEMTDARREKLRALLKSHFGLDDLAVAQLIRGAAEAARSAVDLYHFTRQLNGVLDSQGRQHVVKMMWQVIYVFWSADNFESNIYSRTAHFSRASPRPRSETRQRI